MQKANRQRPMAAFSTTNHELRINTHELQATSYRLRTREPNLLNSVKLTPSRFSDWGIGGKLKGKQNRLRKDGI